MSYLTRHIAEWGKNPFKKIHLEMLLLHVIQSVQKISIDSLISRLITLEQSISKKELSIPPPPKAELKPETPPAPKLETPPPPIEEKKPSSPPPVKKDPTLQQAKYDTMMRFAAVELDGVVRSPK